MGLVFKNIAGAGTLDYVACWYLKSAQYITGTRISVAFVSTNSITQGEQVGILSSKVFSRCDLHITFAHRTFAWESEAKGKAHVHVVIIGFASYLPEQRTIFEYESPTGEPQARVVATINGYLADASNVPLRKVSHPVSPVPEIHYGSMMIDKDRKDGDEAGLILSSRRRTELLSECPALKPYIRRIYGGDEFLNGTKRWCLWLADAPPTIVRECRLLKERIDKIRKFRLSSDRVATKKLAAVPHLFGEIRQPATRYLLIPKVSSESRRYIPIGFVKPSIIASGSTLVLPDASLYHFGMLSSEMHNAWIRHVAGRMESRLQYSSQLVYNNYPWPELPTAKQLAAVEAAAKGVLAARDQHLKSGLTLADIYDPLSMPPTLAKTHRVLDRAVDRCYRSQAFTSDRQRMEFLFALYEKLTAPLLPKESKNKQSE